MSDVAKRKSTEGKAHEARRYELARAATNDDDFESFYVDASQPIRNAAAVNVNASAAVLDQFAADPFWSVRIAVAEHRNTARRTLLRLLESDPRRRGLVHHAVRRRLESEGVRFGDDSMPLED